MQRYSFFILISFAMLFQGCNLLKMLPKKPVLRQKERDVLLNQAALQPQYESNPQVNFPVLPLQVWAASYDLDIVLVSKHPDWNMHELARLSTPSGPLWIMKDADEKTLNQTITADLTDIQQWLPEIPVKRKSYPVKVTDESTEKLLNLQFEYENFNGELTEISYQGPYPKKKQPKRNGSTMGHSQAELMAVLDLPLRNFGKRASISYNGKPYSVKKILGLQPFQMALVQTQAGLSIGNYEISMNKKNQLISRHLNGPVAVEQFWKMEETEKELILIQQNEWRTIRYFFKKDGNYQLLYKASVQAWNKMVPDFELQICPALPDLRCRFKGEFSSSFIMDVNGQASHACGAINAHWTEEGPTLDIIPEKPWWVADRPMRSVLFYQKNKVGILIQRQ